MEKILTIIVPVYNGQDYISTCLESLEKQTSDQIEILIVDDGSNDDTSKIINKYLERNDNFRCIHKENGGISSARNAGIKAINTKYFGFVDSDDWVEPEMFEVMLNQIIKEDADLCVCNYIWQWPNKTKYSVDGPYYDSKEMIVKLMATLWNKIYKTDLIEKYDLSFPNGFRYEDAYFLYCLASNPIKIVFVDNYFVHYIQREGSITHNHNDKVKDMIVVFDKIIEYYEAHNKKEEYSQELEFLFAKFFLGNSFLRACQIKDANERALVLELSWKSLDNHYPNFKKNKYLDTFSFPKKMYYRYITKGNYKFIGKIINLLYSVK